MASLIPEEAETILELEEKLFFWRGKKKRKLTLRERDLKIQNGHIIQIHLRDRQLREFPVPTSLKKLSKLEVLLLDCNDLPNFPEFTDQLSHLKVLDLSSNKLTKIPDSIGNLSKLEVLLLDNNLLSTFPEFSDHFSHLKVLDISSNEFTRFPDSISKLTNLKELDIGYNEIKKIPPSIGKLKNLKILNLINNPIKEISPQIRKIGYVDILPYFFNDLTDSEIYMQIIYKNEGDHPRLKRKRRLNAYLKYRK